MAGRAFLQERRATKRAVRERRRAGRTLGVPHAFVLTLLIAALAWWYLRHTAGGRHFYAIGGDPQAARLAGIDVRGRILAAYVVTGLLVGLAYQVIAELSVTVVMPGAKVIVIWLASSLTKSSWLKSIPRSKAARVTDRYIAPVSQ